MSYYWFNRKELLQKAKDKYNYGGKKKAAEYYLKNKDVIKEKENDSIKICQKKKKKQRENIVKIGIKKRKKIQNKTLIFAQHEMSEKTLKFGDIVVSKK